MTELLKTIKQAALEAVEEGEPAAPFVGTVVKQSPLLVHLNQRLTLPGRRLLFLRELRAPREGDKLALLRFAGGQQYLVLGYL